MLYNFVLVHFITMLIALVKTVVTDLLLFESVNIIVSITLRPFAY